MQGFWYNKGYDLSSLKFVGYGSIVSEQDQMAEFWTTVRTWLDRPKKKGSKEKPVCIRLAKESDDFAEPL